MDEIKVPMAVGQRGLVLRDLDDYWRFATAVSKSGLAPYGFNKPEQVLVAVQTGAELGMSPMQSLQGLVVIKGKVSMYGDTARALVEADPVCEYISDNLNELTGQTVFEDSTMAWVEAKRKGRPQTVKRSFSVGDAKLAGLWGKVGKKTGEPTPWVTYPGRMLYYRALGFCLRDAFPDVLKGIKTAEELRDYPQGASRVHTASVQAVSEWADDITERKKDDGTDETESGVSDSGTG